MRRIAVLITGLAGTICGSANLSSQTPDPNTFLVVDSVTQDASATTPRQLTGKVLPIEIKMRNVSTKSITAYAISITIEYADRSRQTIESGEDLIYPMGEAQAPGVLPIPNTILNPNEAHLFKQWEPLPPSGVLPTTLTARITKLVFGDRTSVGDCSKIFQGRRETVEELTDLLVKVREAESSKNPSQRYGELASGLKPLHPGWAVSQVNAHRLVEYGKVRGTPVYDLMRSVDESTLKAINEHSVPADSDGGPKK